MSITTAGRAAATDWLRHNVSAADVVLVKASRGAALELHTQRWCDALNRSGKAYLTPATLDGRWMVRVSVGSEYTEQAHVEALWANMRAEAEQT